jgi:diacylglycerol kinase (ATP)
MASYSTKIRRLIKSFGYALKGLHQMVKTEQNARVHLMATVLVLIAALLLGLTATEWCLILLCMALVWAAEAFNTAIETVTDHLFKERNETARIIKDVAAGAVLVCAVAAAACGLIIFIPKILALF